MAEYEFLHFPAEAVKVDEAQFAALPESARRVFEAVKENGPLTHAGLRAATNLPPRTVRFAVKRLKDEGFIDTRCSLRDCRTCYFFVSRRCVEESALEAARKRAEDAIKAGRLVEQV
jgi:DNA-binding Lrp family transcriptional regulator